MAAEIPPLPQPEPPRKTFFHQAATYSSLAAVIAIGITVVAAIVRATVSTQVYTHPEVAPSPAAITVMLLTVLLALSGMLLVITGGLAGLVALTGIPRYGPTGILWKAITGLLIFGLLILGAAPNFIRAWEITHRNSQSQHRQSPP